MSLHGVATGERETEAFRRRQTDPRGEFVQRVHGHYAARTRSGKRDSHACLA
jgi:hypothetical protein